MINNSKSSTYTVQISFIRKGGDTQYPKPDVYIVFPLGTPLPHVDDKILIGDNIYKVADRSLIVSDDITRDASWSLAIDDI